MGNIMKSWSLNSKILSILILVTAVMILLSAGVVVFGIDMTRVSLESSFNQMVKKRQAQMVKYKDAEVDREGHLQLELVTNVGKGFISNYDYESLKKVAKSVEGSINIVKVEFLDREGSEIVENSVIYDEGSKDIKVISQEIMEGDEFIGEVRVILDFKNARQQLLKGQDKSNKLLAKIGIEVRDKEKRFLIISIICMIVLMFIFLVVVQVLFKTKIINFLIRLSGLLEKISTQIRTQSNETKLSGEKLSNSSSEQISSLHLCISAVEEMQSLVDQTANNTKVSLEVTKEVIDLSQHGDKVMGRLGGAMEHFQAFGEQLKEIVAIIADISLRTNVINDIVFKTQLLSFNASIEAARAGQHGRGFSVVAEEVGKLAKISGTAAADIHQLLEQSKGRVEGLVKVTGDNISEGKTVYDDAKVVFTDILASINKVNSNMNDISLATNEQGQGIRQVSETITTVDQIATENAKAAKASEKISVELVSSGSDLKSLFDSVTGYIFGTNEDQDDDEAFQAEEFENELEGEDSLEYDTDEFEYDTDELEDEEFEDDEEYEYVYEDELDNNDLEYTEDDCEEDSSNKVTVDIIKTKKNNDSSANQSTVYQGIGTATDSAGFDDLGIPSADQFDSDINDNCAKEKIDNSIVPGKKESDKLSKIVDDLASKAHSGSCIHPGPAEDKELKQIDPDEDDFE